MMQVVLPGVLAASASALVGAWFRRWALRQSRALDLPNQRSSHRTPTPRGGGVGIVVGVLVGLAAWLLLGGSLSPRALGWLAGALLVAGVSFLDDLRPLPAAPRLATHATAAGVATLVGVQDAGGASLLAVALAFLWIVLLTNVYNFMDGIDGLAAGQAVVAGLAYAAAGLLGQNSLIAASGAVLAGGSAGFLVHNVPSPARLFMGDVASTFLGYSFATLALLGNLGVGGARIPWELGVVALAPFLFDGLATLSRRALRGERWFEAHRSHYYQRLVQAGLTHGQVSLLYGLLGTWAALLAVGLVAAAEPSRPLLGAAAFLPMLGVVALVWRLERSHVDNVP